MGAAAAPGPVEPEASILTDLTCPHGFFVLQRFVPFFKRKTHGFWSRTVILLLSLRVNQMLHILIMFWFPGTETNDEFLLSCAVCSLCEPPPISMCEGVFAAVCDRLVEVLVLCNIHLLLAVTERTGAAADSHLIIFSLLKHLPFLFLCVHSAPAAEPNIFVCVLSSWLAPHGGAHTSCLS